MKTNRTGGIARNWIAIFVVIIILALYQVPLPYYYTQPGEAATLEGLIEVEGGYDEEGEFHLTTVRQSRANIPLWVWEKFSDYRHLYPREQLIPEGETDEEYFHRQDMLMRDSQDAAKIIAYKKAGKVLDINYEGVRVTDVIEGMNGASYLKAGDVITAIDHQRVEKLEDMLRILSKKQVGDTVDVEWRRDGETLEETIVMDTFPNEMEQGERAGLGVSYPITQRDLTFEPEVTIDAGNIGGPSAGLMFALDIYNQLTEEDLTKGKKIAGTGSINEEGEVGPIGGIKQKVVAAERSDIEIFFAPDTGATSPTNYEEAVEAAEDINAEMKIIPVQTFDDALHYLKNLE